MNSNTNLGICQRAILAFASAFFIVQLTFVDRLQIPFASIQANFPWTGLAILAFLLLISRVRRTIKQGQPLWNGPILFLFVLFTFLSNFRSHCSDDLSTGLLPFSILRHGTLTLDHYVIPWFAKEQADNVVQTHGHFVSFFPILAAVLSLPVYLLPVLRGIEPTTHVLHQLEKISASLMCALAVLFLFRLYRRKTTASWAFGLAVVYALGTNTFSTSSQALWQHGASCLMLVLCLWFMDLSLVNLHYWYLCGFFAALSVSARCPNIIFYAGFLLAAFLKDRRAGAMRYLAGGIIPWLLLVSYWKYVVGTGLPAEFGHQATMFHFPPPARAILGLLVSPARGVFVFSPVVLFCLWGALRSLRHNSTYDKRLAVPIILSILASFILFASYQAWESGWSFGPRYLIEPVTVLFYFLPLALPSVQTNRAVAWLWWFAVFASIVCHAVGAYSGWDWEKLTWATHSVWNFKAYPPLYLCTSFF